MIANGGKENKTSPILISALIAVLIIGLVTFMFASMRISREIDHSAATMGSSTLPKDSGSNMDRTKRTSKDDPQQMQETNGIGK